MAYIMFCTSIVSDIHRTANAKVVASELETAILETFMCFKSNILQDPRILLLGSHLAEQAENSKGDVETNDGNFEYDEYESESYKAQN